MTSIDHSSTAVMTVEPSALLVATLDIPRARIALAGELDLSTTHVLREALDVLTADTTSTITLDLADLRFIDATGIGEIVRSATRLDAIGRRLAVTGASARISRTFSLAGHRP